ncbi:GntR family transcriptional regulator [Streptomyces sp. NRRL S-813]|uniref:GntR family transcriptional regulator n=1 Tax=Streptomyces sp. NRRL S-813 TaxID=1463919 RepID=UPI00068AD1F9|nr:GntR family transcriptional regulator [Streptomyces sp. NRRL S-813]
MNSDGRAGKLVEGLAALEARPSRRNEVTRDLRAAVISGQMRTGVVYSAPALASQFGVSPTPVREAMLNLSKEGLVEIVRNKGFRVVEPSEEELDDILELRMLLEVPMVTKLAAMGVSSADLVELDKLADETVRHAENRDITGHVTADIDFHLALLALTDNSQIVDVVRVLRAKSRLFGLDSPAKAERLLASSREHRQLVALLRARDTVGTQDLMGRHISAVRELWGRDSES